MNMPKQCGMNESLPLSDSRSLTKRAAVQGAPKPTLVNCIGCETKLIPKNKFVQIVGRLVANALAANAHAVRRLFSDYSLGKFLCKHKFGNRL